MHRVKTEFVDVSPTRKEIKIEIEPAAIRETYDQVSDRYAKQASVPGFRPGHAPRAVVRNRFKSEIRAEVLQQLIPDAVNEAIDKHELNAIKEPDVELEHAARGPVVVQPIGGPEERGRAAILADHDHADLVEPDLVDEQPPAGRQRVELAGVLE